MQSCDIGLHKQRFNYTIKLSNEENVKRTLTPASHDYKTSFEMAIVEIHAVVS